jgi:hypothetical protein
LDEVFEFTVFAKKDDTEVVGANVYRGGMKKVK